MSEKEMETYNFIIGYMKENGFPPTVREIAKGIDCVASVVMKYLMGLEAQGKIKSKPGCSRAIKVFGYKFMKMEV